MHQLGTHVGVQVEQPPGFGLRIVLVKVGKEGVVSEVLQARGVVSHAVRFPGNEETGLAVAMSPLVHAGEIAQMGRWPVCGDRSLVHARDGGRVVRAADEGCVPDVMVPGHDVILGQLSRVFQVAVGDGSSGFFPGDEAGLDVSGVGLTPHVALLVGVKVHSAHAGLGRVRGS